MYWFIRILWLVWVSAVILICGLCAYFMYISYAVALEQIISLLSLEDKRVQISTQIFFENRFYQIRYLLLLLSLLGLISLFFAYDICKRLGNEVRWFLENLHLAYLRYMATWGHLTRLEKILVWVCFVVGLAPIFWRIWVYSYWVDEVFSYVFLVKRGIFVSLTYYPGPNNHIFFTGVSSMFVAMIGDIVPPIVLMRLLAFSGILATSFVLFGWLLIRKGWGIACLGVLLLLFQSPIQMYGYLGRGYAWEILFFLIAFIGFWEWGRQGRFFYFVMGCISSVAGFYTLPTFLYAFLGLINPKDLFKQKFFFGLMAVGICTLVLYTPIILLNGWQTVSGNAWLSVGKDVFWQNFLSGEYLVEVISFWGFEVSLWGAWGIFLVLLWRFWIAERQASQLFFRLFFVPILVLCYQQVLPPARVWSYGSILIVMATLPRKGLDKSICIVWLGLCLWNFVSYWQFSPALPAHVEIAKLIYKKNAKTVFANEDTYQMFIRYEYALGNKPLKIYTNHEVYEYDIFIISKALKKPKCFLPAHYKLFFENTEVVVFEKK